MPHAQLTQLDEKSHNLDCLVSINKGKISQSKPSGIFRNILNLEEKLKMSHDCVKTYSKTLPVPQLAVQK